MKKTLLTLLLLTTILFAQEKTLSSTLVIDGEHYSRDHESVYGVCNTYAFLVAEHQIQRDSTLLFYYGTKVGIVSEGYSARNGFGPEVDALGIILKANIGLTYKIEKYEQLSVESSHIDDLLHEQVDSRLKVSYNYYF